MSEASRLRELTESGLLHANPEAVRSQLFTAGGEFFLAADKVQVKYEMLRAHLADGRPVTDAAAAHGYSRAAFYLVLASFSQAGMSGLLDERRGRRGPMKLRPEILEFIRAADAGPGMLAEQVADRFGCGCTGGPSSGPGSGEYPVVLAAGRGGAGRLRDIARASAQPRRAAR